MEARNAEARPPDEFAGIWIGVLMLLVAIPVTAWGMLNEPNRWAFWLFVPPLVAGALAIGPVWAVNRKVNPEWVSPFAPLVYALVFPLAGLLFYLVYYLPVLGAWILTGASLGLHEDSSLVLDYLGVWWAGLTAVLFLNLRWPKLAQTVLDWVMPRDPSGERPWFRSYLVAVMPWVVFLMRLFRTRWWKRNWKYLLLAWVAGFCGGVVVGPGGIAPVEGFETLAEILGWVLIGSLAFFALNGLVAAVLLSSDTFQPSMSQAAIGLGVWAVSAALGGTLEDLGWTVLMVGAGLVFPVSLISVLPVFGGVASVIARPHGVARFGGFLAIALYPAAYYPFHLEARRDFDFFAARAEAEALLEQGEKERAIEILENLFEHAVEREMSYEAVSLANHLASHWIDQQDFDKAVSYTDRALALVDVDDVFAWGREYTGPARTVQAIEDRRRFRAEVLDAMVYRYTALFRLNRSDEALQGAMRTRDLALSIQDWYRFGGVSRGAAIMWLKVGRVGDAVHALGVARLHIVRQEGPEDEARRLDQALEDLRRSVGDEAYRAAVEECARRDPESCGASVR